MDAGTAWGNQYDSGYRGECVVQRQPPCCGEEPDCKIGPQSPLGCITRDPDFIPAHNSSATCVCADTYTGIDCGSSIADEIIAREKAKGLDGPSGCFALEGQVQVLAQGACKRACASSHGACRGAPGTNVLQDCRRQCSSKEGPEQSQGVRSHDSALQNHLRALQKTDQAYRAKASDLVLLLISLNLKSVLPGKCK